VAAFKRAADQRPFDVLANFEAAQETISVLQNIEEARPYINRVDELIKTNQSSEQGFYAAKRWLKMFRAYEAWTSGDLVRAQSIIDREAAQLSEWPDERRSQIPQTVAFFYMTLGRLHDAERVMQAAEQINLDGYETANYVFELLADLRDDLPALRRIMLRIAPIQEAYLYVKAGLIDRARAKLQINLGGLDEGVNSIGRGALELATGSPERAVGLLRAAIALPTDPPFSAYYQDTCGLLAEALTRTGRRAEAIVELEQCATKITRFNGNFLASKWMKNLLRLADEYRIVGRTGDAQQIEQRLRKLLVYADADNALVIRLNAR
jgi:tetratricopeptide (TPR) repeat protein